MKRKITLLLLIVGFFPITAQNVLNVHSRTGAIVTYAFSEKPVVTYREDILVLTTEKTQVEYPISDLEKLTFSDTESAIERISSKDIAGDGTIRIFDISGRSVRTIEAAENVDGTLRLLLNDLEKGIYIVKQGKIFYKIIKR